ncbi:MAG: hypothetical protein CML65_19465 [Rhodobacteraceae bacterium]|nr:hypothetical protein [Paracoccaceae bacterium]
MLAGGERGTRAVDQDDRARRPVARQRQHAVKPDPTAADHVDRNAGWQAAQVLRGKRADIAAGQRQRFGAGDVVTGRPDDAVRQQPPHPPGRQVAIKDLGRAAVPGFGDVFRPVAEPADDPQAAAQVAETILQVTAHLCPGGAVIGRSRQVPAHVAHGEQAVRLVEADVAFGAAPHAAGFGIGVDHHHLRVPGQVFGGHEKGVQPGDARADDAKIATFGKV